MVQLKFSLPKGQKRVAISETGLFPCPNCQADCTYDAMAIHETTGLLGRFVPGVHGTLIDVIITCHRCRSQFPSHVRDRPLYADRPFPADDPDTADDPDSTDDPDTTSIAN